jgi:hypothetical protein
MFTYELQRRLVPTGAVAVAAHPAGFDCRVDPMADHWPLLVAEPLDGERLVNSQLRPRVGAIAIGRHDSTHCPWVSRRRSVSDESLGADAGVGRPA